MIMCCPHTPFLSESFHSVIWPWFENLPCSLFSLLPTHQSSISMAMQLINSGHLVVTRLKLTGWSKWKTLVGGGQTRTHRIFSVIPYPSASVTQSEDGWTSLLIRTAEVYGNRVCQEPGKKRFYGLDHSWLSSEISWSPTPQSLYNLQTVPEAWPLPYSALSQFKD